MPHNVAGGWGGRIRTFNLLIQSQLRYRCATPQNEYDRGAILSGSFRGSVPSPGADR